MPSTYAHYRMGEEVRKRAVPETRAVIEACPELFFIGLHGPDILFYYKPLSSNPVNAVGYSAHDKAGGEFFENAAAVIRIHGNQMPYLSYVYGFLCHFALDVTCHGYIDEKVRSSGVSHGEIEVEFDRRLMLEDGLDPVRHRLTDHIIPSMENAEVIQAFFPVTASEAQKALKGMIWSNRILLAPSKIKRGFISMLLRMTGNYEEMRGLMVNYEENPLCTDSTEKLLGLYDDAKDLACRLIEEFGGYLAGEGGLNEIYQYTFDSKLTRWEETADAGNGRSNGYDRRNGK